MATQTVTNAASAFSAIADRASRAATALKIFVTPHVDSMKFALAGDAGKARMLARAAETVVNFLGETGSGEINGLPVQTKTYSFARGNCLDNSTNLGGQKSNAANPVPPHEIFKITATSLDGAQAEQKFDFAEQARFKRIEVSTGKLQVLHFDVHAPLWSTPKPTFAKVAGNWEKDLLILARAVQSAQQRGIEPAKLRRAIEATPFVGIES